MSNNRVSVKLSSTELSKINKAVSDLKAVLKPALISLTPSQRREIPKMSDGTLPFVEKVMDYAKSNHEFCPRYMDVAEMQIDVNAAEKLTEIYRPLLQLIQQLDDSIMLSGSEAYVAALAYYNSVGIGARMNVPGAKAIREDLSKRFAKASGRGNGTSGAYSRQRPGSLIFSTGYELERDSSEPLRGTSELPF